MFPHLRPIMPVHLIMKLEIKTHYFYLVRTPQPHQGKQQRTGLLSHFDVNHSHPDVFINHLEEKACTFHPLD